jgi:prophage regulatory protein
MTNRLLSISQVTDRVPFTKVHIYRLMKRGEFPRTIKIGKRRVCWRESEIDAWIASKASVLAGGAR